MIFFFILLAVLLPPVGIPILLIYWLVRKKKNIQKQKETLMIAVSREDAVSQWFFFLSVSFFGVTLMGINQQFHLMSWQTILLFTALAGLVISYLYKSVGTLIMSLVTVVTWWGFQAFAWSADRDIETYGIFLGVILFFLVFYVMGNYYRKNVKFKRFRMVYLVLGIVGIVGNLFIFSSRFGLEILSGMTIGGGVWNGWQVALSLGVMVLVLAAGLVFITVKKFLLPGEAVAVGLLALLFIIPIFLPEQSFFVYQQDAWAFVANYNSGNTFTASGLVWAVLFNVTVFFALLGLIFSGYVRREEWLINLGVFFLFVLIFMKYFDWFFSFLDKSLFFIGAGILLFALGWGMEKGRRQMVAQIKTQQTAKPT
ncbi:MAG TPA: hypothetical protein VLF20_06610 [Patescibacteria group bacterium]|nr:hypothetical protein [Patescibacteria group bacterium]